MMRFPEARRQSRDMAQAAREIDVPGGKVRLRPAQEGDAAFQLELFRSHMVGMLRLGGFPDAMIESLLSMQYGSRLQTYRAKFPEALWSIIESDAKPIGELIEHDEEDGIYVVDVALLPEHQRRGIGTALMRAVMHAGALRGGVRALVFINNETSLRMFRRLGFSETNRAGDPLIEFRWRPRLAPGEPVKPTP